MPPIALGSHQCRLWQLIALLKSHSQVASTATLSHILDATGTKRHHQGNKKLSDSQTNRNVILLHTPTNQYVRQFNQHMHANMQGKETTAPVWIAPTRTRPTPTTLKFWQPRSPRLGHATLFWAFRFPCFGSRHTWGRQFPKSQF